MINYLDALPQTTAPTSGSGMPSYAASLNQAASAATVAPVAPAAPAPAAPVTAAAASTTFAAPNVGSYIEALSSGASSVSGPGITTYLDALPRASGLAGGGGINTYANALRSVSVISGPGFNTYTDALSPNSVSGKSFSVFSGSKSASKPAFSIGSLTGTFDFTIEADDAFIAKLREAGNRRVTIKGKVNKIN
jgi:hypothetical protein